MEELHRRTSYNITRLKPGSASFIGYNFIMTMQEVTINGRVMKVQEDYTITRLLEQLAIKGRFAVEVNEAIVPRSEYANYPLQAGDRVEIVRAIGGG
jgi:sulfur carrier protein